MKKYKKKYNKGTQKVDVPPTMTGADVGAQALSGAAAGAAMGSVAGPWGTAIGGVVGGGVGLVKGITAKDAAKAANTKANAINAQADINQKMGIDSKLQNYQYKKGSSKLHTKEIEIEGKKFPEIHTDKNYNIKTLGETPHSEGGTKTIAEEGDVVFDTQNSEKDYKKVMYDINLYKMKGDKNALKRLEQRRKEMPADTGTEKRWGSNGEWIPDEVTVGQSNTNYGWTPNTQQIQTDNLGVQPNPLVSEDTYDSSLGQLSYTDLNQGNNYKAPQTQQFNTVQPSTINNESNVTTNAVPMPMGFIPDEGGGRSTIADKPVARQPKQLGNIGRYANIAYNAVQSFNKPQPILQRELQLNRYKYSDMSDPLREAARQNRATALYNAGRAGSSIGQQQSYGQQAQNNYISQLGGINAGENERKQNIQNANVDVSNQENQVNYERAYQNNDIAAKRRAAQQSYGAAAASEASSLAEVQKQEQLQKIAEQNRSDRDKQYLNLLGTNNYGYDENLNQNFKRTYSKGSSGVKTRYVYKSSTKKK